MTISKLDQDLKLCETHLKTTDSMGTEIESFFTNFLLVRICAEYEQEIKKIIIERAKQTGDKELVSFIEKTIERFTSVNLEHLRDKVLKRFSDDCLNKFNKAIIEESRARYGNIVKNRNQSAHGGSINITFDELLTSHEKAKDVLKALSYAINS